MMKVVSNLQKGSEETSEEKAGGGADLGGSTGVEGRGTGAGAGGSRGGARGRGGGTAAGARANQGRGGAGGGGAGSAGAGLGAGAGAGAGARVRAGAGGGGGGGGRARARAGGRGGGGGGARAGGGASGRAGGAVVDDNAGVVARFVGVGVGGAGVVVGDGDRLDSHGEGTVGVVSLTTGPLDGTLGLGGVTSSPDTELQAHGSLGVASTALSIAVGKGAHDSAIDAPGSGGFSPLNGVSVEGLLGGRHSCPSSTVVGGGVTLAEVVGLNLSGVTTKSFLNIPIWLAYYPMHIG